MKNQLFYLVSFDREPMTATVSRGPLHEGEAVIFVDPKEREYLKRLEQGKKISIRGGRILSEEVIGREEGSVVRSSLNELFLVFRPSLAELIPNLPRMAQVIYPKDIGPILVWADIFPGAKVVEAGVGPGALTIALLRSVGSEGHLISYEVREDFARMAEENVKSYYGSARHWTLKIGDVSQQLEETDVDRLLLDLPEPWHVIDRAWQALRPGGIVLSYLPTVIQVKSLVDSLRGHGGFARIETMECLLRFWHIKEQSMRPEHRMVAHTGFITVARRIAERNKI
ncbi:MAG TPA: tRNA (adenine-N1)-methyltransferase [Candidatus Binatia bacterium]|nr:tRNA (adenine-N1)-methyltransferase [Candidatus Binatia bacterium]